MACSPKKVLKSKGTATEAVALINQRQPPPKGHICGAKSCSMCRLIAIGVTDGRPSLVFLTVEHWSTWRLWLAAAWRAMRSATWKNSVNQFVAVALLLLPAYGERWFAYSAYAPEALFWRLLEVVVVLLAIRGVDPLARGLRYPVMMLAAVQSLGWLADVLPGRRSSQGCSCCTLGVACSLWKGRAQKPFPATEA